MGQCYSPAQLLFLHDVYQPFNDRPVSIATMTTSLLFREYILLRARSVLYVALLVALAAVVALVFLAAASSENITRAGLVFQLLAVLAVLPEVVGKSNLPSFRLNQADNNATILETTSQTPFEFYLSHNQLFVLGNILASLGLGWLWVDQVLFPALQRPGWEVALRLASGMLGFAWLDLFMAALIYRLLPSSAPAVLIRLFFVVDFLVSFFGMVLAATAFLVERWVFGALRFIYQEEPDSTRRVLLWVSLPFFLFGIVLALLATWV
jgi:hypothetical protein